MHMTGAFVFPPPPSDDRAPRSSPCRAAVDHPSTAHTGKLSEGGTTVSLLSLLRVRKPDHNSIKGSRRPHPRLDVELREGRALLSGIEWIHQFGSLAPKWIVISLCSLSFDHHGRERLPSCHCWAGQGPSWGRPRRSLSESRAARMSRASPARVLGLEDLIREARKSVDVPIPVTPKPGQCRPCGIRGHSGRERLWGVRHRRHIRYVSTRENMERSIIRNNEH
jgi:hypothetical protein